jgi:hypothetical protein
MQITLVNEFLTKLFRKNTSTDSTFALKIKRSSMEQLVKKFNITVVIYVIVARMVSYGLLRKINTEHRSRVFSISRDRISIPR